MRASVIYLTILFFTSFLVYLSAYTEDRAVSALHVSKYSNADLGIANINYPSFPIPWKIVEGASNVTFISPKENEGDRFSETVNIKVENISGARNISLTEYADKSVALLKSMLRPGIVLEILESNSSMQIAGFPAMKITYDIYSDISQQDPELRADQYFIKTNDNIFYGISYTAKPPSYEVFLPTLSWMISSLDLLRN